jgi:O-antigen/teichoic acid export membrane protein
LISLILNKKDFGLYSFSIVLTSLIVVIINSSTDSLINNDLASGGKDYKNFLYYKLLLILVSISFLVAFFYDNVYVVIMAASIFPVVISEHFEIKLRFNNDYDNFIYKFYLQILFFLIKIFILFNYNILSVIVFSVVESFFYLIVNCFYIGKYNLLGGSRGFLIFIFDEKSKIGKFTLGSFLIFTFFKVDQIYSYMFFGSGLYASYAMACKFNEIHNNLVGIWTRYTTPEAFKSTSAMLMREILLKNIAAHVFFFILVMFAMIFFTTHINNEYKDSVFLYFILAFGGLFLLFGQIRGIYFVKRGKVFADVINALVGIFSFFISLFFLKMCYNINVAISFAYVISFFISGLLITAVYKTGRIFLKELFLR